MTKNASRRVYNNTNLYDYSSVLKKSGAYSIQVLYQNLPVVSPKEFYIHPAETSAAHSTVEGRGTTLATQYQPTPIVITARDIYGNPRESGGDKVTVRLVAVESADGVITDNKDGTYTAIYVVKMMGTYSLLVRIIPPLAKKGDNGIHIKGSPFTPQINLEGASQLQQLQASPSQFALDGWRHGLLR